MPHQLGMVVTGVVAMAAGRGAPETDPVDLHRVHFAVDTFWTASPRPRRRGMIGPSRSHLLREAI
jgi:hypothetical protein